MVVPVLAIFVRVSKIFCASLGARPRLGSSKSKSLGLLIKALPIDSICCSPPDRVPADWFLLGGFQNREKDFSKRIQKCFSFWKYEVAAKLGNGVASYRLGNFYEEGTYVSKSDKKALEWYRKAAGKKFPPSFLKLAEYFRDGKEVKTNLVYAHAYFNVASSFGSNKAKEEIAKIEKNLSVEDNLKAQTIARKIQQNPATKLK